MVDLWQLYRFRGVHCSARITTRQEHFTILHHLLHIINTTYILFLWFPADAFVGDAVECNSRMKPSNLRPECV